MAHESIPSKRPWEAWGGDLKLSRSWPSSQAGIDVDIHQLMKVGREMQTDMDTTTKKEVSRGYDSDSLPPRLKEFDLTSVGNSLWESMDTFLRALRVINQAAYAGIKGIHTGYRGVGGLAFASGANYQAAEKLFDEFRPVLKRALHGWGADHEIYRITSKWKDEDDISQWDAETIKGFVNDIDVRNVATQAALCEEVAGWLSDLQDNIEGRARQLSKAWPGETSGFALEALHEVQGTCRSLAYALGKTGDTLVWFTRVLDKYQWEFESKVKIGYFDIDDDMPSWLGFLPGGGANERAHDYLRELKKVVATAYHMLPVEIEVLVPDVPDDYSIVFGYYNDDKLKNDSPYWDFLKLDLQGQRKDAESDIYYDDEYKKLQAGQSKSLPPVKPADIWP